MTALDQAFIKAYLQRDGIAAATPLDSARPVPLKDAFGDRPVQETATVAATTPGPPDLAATAPSVEQLGAPGHAACPNTEPPDEPAADSPVEPVMEPPIEPVVELPIEPVMEPPVELAAETPIEPDRAAETLVENPTEVECVSVDEAPAVAEEPAMRPSFQVDGFAWPSGCARLGVEAGDPLERVADELTAGLTRGQSVVAMSGCRRGEGCTTLLLGIARRLARTGLKVAVVDADFDRPELARQLGLLPEAGWEEVLAGRLPLAEALIESIQDGIVVLPLCGPVPDARYLPTDHPGPARSIAALRRQYDLVLIDLGAMPGEAGGGAWPAEPDVRWVDAVVLVHNVRSTPAAELERARRWFGAAGVVEAGVVENFT